MQIVKNNKSQIILKELESQKSLPILGFMVLASFFGLFMMVKTISNSMADLDHSSVALERSSSGKYQKEISDLREHVSRLQDYKYKYKEQLNRAQLRSINSQIATLNLKVRDLTRAYNSFSSLSREQKSPWLLSILSIFMFFMALLYYIKNYYGKKLHLVKLDRISNRFELRSGTHSRRYRLSDIKEAYIEETPSGYTLAFETNGGNVLTPSKTSGYRRRTIEGLTRLINEFIELEKSAPSETIFKRV